MSRRICLHVRMLHRTRTNVSLPFLLESVYLLLVRILHKSDIKVQQFIEVKVTVINTITLCQHVIRREIDGLCDNYINTRQCYSITSTHTTMAFVVTKKHTEKLFQTFLNVSKGLIIGMPG